MRCLRGLGLLGGASVVSFEEGESRVASIENTTIENGRYQ